WRGLAPPSVVIVDAFGLGIANAFASPAANALYASLVPREDLPSAVALNSLTWNLARAIGPALAGVTVRYLGVAPAFALNAASYIALAVGVFLSRPRPLDRGPATSFRESFRLLRADPKLLAYL